LIWLKQKEYYYSCHAKIGIDNQRFIIIRPDNPVHYLATFLIANNPMKPMAKDEQKKCV
jgi:hypothetical protein